MNDRRDKPRPKSILTNIYDATHDVLRKYETSAPVCLIHGIPMTSAGNGWSCRLCVSEQVQENDAL